MHLISDVPSPRTQTIPLSCIEHVLDPSYFHQKFNADAQSTLLSLHTLLANQYGTSGHFVVPHLPTEILQQMCR
jgi:hypothetical protein